MPQLRTRCDAHHKKALCVGQRRVVRSADGPLAHSCMSRANNAFDVSEEFGPAFGTPGDQRLFTRKLSAFDLSFPKIISAHSDGAVRKELAW
jgi:hypothetical protein